jgi:sugar-specific transcriptional regulator TrmB
LEKFGLAEDEIRVYLALTQIKTATVAQLSKQTDINRTTLYRLLAQLEKVGLVKNVLGYKTSKYQAENPQKLESMIIKQEENVLDLKNALSHIVTEVGILSAPPSGSTDILYFQGKEGLKQMLWNTLQAGKNGEVVGFGYLSLNEGVGKFFAENIRKQYIENTIKKKEILNFDQVEPEEVYTKLGPDYRKIYEARGIDKSKIEIYHDIMIYNNVVTFYHTINGELFGVEIHNPLIAKMQKQIFAILWDTAKTMQEVLDSN